MDTRGYEPPAGMGACAGCVALREEVRERGVLRRLRAREVELVPARVQRVEHGATEEPLTVRTDDGATVELDAIFVAGVGRPHDSYLADFNLERTETPFGNFIAIGRGGSTGHERIWAAGNVVDPSLNVPMSMGAGSFTGAAVNAFLVEKDFEEAL